MLAEPSTGPPRASSSDARQIARARGNDLLAGMCAFEGPHWKERAAARPVRRVGEVVMSGGSQSGSPHALCLTRGEVLLVVILLAVGIGLSTLHELMFGKPERTWSIAVDATEAGLFWTAVLIGLRRGSVALYRALRTKHPTA